MNQAFYSFDTYSHALRFDFTSIGDRIVRKAVIYTETDTPGLYSVALVDVFEDGSSDDTLVSNNGDMEKILATVYQTFNAFFRYYTNAAIVFAGSTASRTHLYRIAISYEIELLSRYYHVWGIAADELELYQKNRPYTAFIFSLKNTIIV